MSNTSNTAAQIEENSRNEYQTATEWAVGLY